MWTQCGKEKESIQIMLSQVHGHVQVLETGVGKVDDAGWERVGELVRVCLKA
jgi:hypothetical protein